MIDDLQGVIGGKMNVNLMMPIIEYMENGTVTIPIEWFTDMEFIFSLMRIANHLLLNELYDYLFHNCIEANKSNIEVCLKLLSQLVERDPHGLKFESISDWQRKCGNCVEVLKHDFLINGSEDLLRRVFELLNDDIKVSDESIECFKKWLEVHDGANPQIFQELVPMNLFSDDVITFKLIPNGYVDVIKALEWKLIRCHEENEKLLKQLKSAEESKRIFNKQWRHQGMKVDQFERSLAVGKQMKVTLGMNSGEYIFGLRMSGYWETTVFKGFYSYSASTIVVCHVTEKTWEIRKENGEVLKAIACIRATDKFLLKKKDEPLMVYVQFSE
eukprot:TRINITY_DN166611_c0_g2_i2.p1 TRINITY_DN166611_c0_g2~~TRINITY_DN166611_c0_g2_i2.p1  ORF type:complete len:329 (+),score=64.57 TRINITY_DN166611_c0_g2_i2:953-1939(+)